MKHRHSSRLNLEIELISRSMHISWLLSPSWSPNWLPKVDFAGRSTSTIYSSQSWEWMSYVSCGFDSGSHHGMWKMRENMIRYNLILKWWREGGGEKCWFKRKTFQNFLKRFSLKINSLIWDVPCFEGFPWKTTMAARRKHG